MLGFSPKCLAIRNVTFSIPSEESVSFFHSAQMFFRELCNRLLSISSGVEDELLTGQHVATVASELVVMSLWRPVCILAIPGFALLIKLGVETQRPYADTVSHAHLPNPSVEESLCFPLARARLYSILPALCRSAADRSWYCSYSEQPRWLYAFTANIHAGARVKICFVGQGNLSDSFILSL